MRPVRDLRPVTDIETSVNKDGFRSNDGATASCRHNGTQEERTYPHPVIQVTLRILLEKTDQEGKALEGAVFRLRAALDRRRRGRDLDPVRESNYRGGLYVRPDQLFEIRTSEIIKSVK